MKKIVLDNNIPFVDLRNQYLKIKGEIDSVVLDAIQNAQYINGPEVVKFADQLKEYAEAKHVITCGNGTDALQIALMTLGLQPGDEVIVPSHTYVSSAEVIALLRLKPVFIDVCPDTFNLDYTQLPIKVTPKTKAIIVVHMYGQCADMEPIKNFAEKNNLYVIEDNAQSIGAVYSFSDGKKAQAGTIGDIGTTSFYPSKNLGAYGDGGAIFIRNKKMAERAAMIANHGQKTRYFHDIVGCNSRLDTIQAAILSVKLKYLNSFISTRQQVASTYDEGFKNTGGIKTPFRSSNSTHVFHQYTLILDEKINREKVKSRLQESGIPTMIYYPLPLHLQKAFYSPSFPEGSLPVSEHLSKSIISLPMHTEMIAEHQEFIIDSVKKVISNQ